MSLLVLYTERLDDCLEFSAGLGMGFTREQHGAGPPHSAAVLDDGGVVELYPAAAGRGTGKLRLGFTVDAARLSSRSDPDGRVVELRVT